MLPPWRRNYVAQLEVSERERGVGVLQTAMAENMREAAHEIRPVGMASRVVCFELNPSELMMSELNVAAPESVVSACERW